MRIIFVRHGEPDYQRDCLTDTGRRQAEAAAVRLAGEGITAVYASPCGRARETAGYTARRLGLEVQTLPFMREIEWGGPHIPHQGHPWTLADAMIDREDFDFAACDWRAHPYFGENIASGYEAAVTRGMDGLLEALGYRHEGRRFFCTAREARTVALFSHGGSGACALAHLLGLPFPWVASVLPYDFASIIILSFPTRPGEWVHPRVELFNDCAHTRGLSPGQSPAAYSG